MKKKYYSPTVSVSAEVCLDEFETEDLIEELQHRQCGGVDTPYFDELQEIHSMLSRGRLPDAVAAIERIIWPKWSSVDQCENAFKAAIGKTAK